MGLTYAVGRGVLTPLGRLLYRPQVEGQHNVPKTGAVIFASNHLSFLDSIAIPIASPRPVHFLAKASYFDGTGFSGWLSREFFTAIGAVPVKRGAGQAALEALDQQRRLLEEGNAVALYPEGTRSLDGRLYKGRTGIAFLALQTGAPVVPVGLIGTDRVMPVGAKMPSMKERVTVKFGAPLAYRSTTSAGRFRRDGPADPWLTWRNGRDGRRAGGGRLTGGATRQRRSCGRTCLMRSMPCAGASL